VLNPTEAECWAAFWDVMVPHLVEFEREHGWRTLECGHASLGSAEHAANGCEKCARLLKRPCAMCTHQREHGTRERPCEHMQMASHKHAVEGCEVCARLLASPCDECVQVGT
jgi:hypothetical protein